MKIYNKLLIILLLNVIGLDTQEVKSQDFKLRNFNGWDIFEWKFDQNMTNKILTQKGIEYTYYESSDEIPARTSFHYKEMETWIYYDSLKQLSFIKQRTDFNVIHNKEAKEFFEKLKKEYIQKYGKPDNDTDDKEKEQVTVIRNLKYTNLCIVYDYKYKIIDELGCGSYSVDIQIYPIK